MTGFTLLLTAVVVFFLVAAACFPLNDGLRAMLTSVGLIDPLTEFVGSMNQPLTFVATFVGSPAMSLVPLEASTANGTFPP